MRFDCGIIISEVKLLSICVEVAENGVSERQSNNPSKQPRRWAFEVNSNLLCQIDHWL